MAGPVPKINDTEFIVARLIKIRGLASLFAFSVNPTKTILVEKGMESQRQSTEQNVQNAKARYKGKGEAYTAGLIELNDLNEEKIKMPFHHRNL